MKKGLIILGIFAVLGFFIVGKYNNIVKSDEEVKKAWSFVQTQYQRRADVFASQLDVVKGAANNEKEILLGITKARSGIVDAQENMKNATTPAQLDQYLQQAQQAALSIKVQIEAYPTIGSTQAFLKFQDEISGTENRIATVRDDYNVVVTTFNKSVRTFPNNLFAGMFGFGIKEQFKSEVGADKRPDISF